MPSWRGRLDACKRKHQSLLSQILVSVIAERIRLWLSYVWVCHLDQAMASVCLSMSFGSTKCRSDQEVSSVYVLSWQCDRVNDAFLRWTAHSDDNRELQKTRLKRSWRFFTYQVQGLFPFLLLRKLPLLSGGASIGPSLFRSVNTFFGRLWNKLSVVCLPRRPTGEATVIVWLTGSWCVQESLSFQRYTKVSFISPSES